MTTYTRTITEECEAKQWNGRAGTDEYALGTKDIVAWIKSLGGEAQYDNNVYDVQTPEFRQARIVLSLPGGRVYIPPSWYVLFRNGRFSWRDPETFKRDGWK